MDRLKKHSAGRYVAAAILAAATLGAVWGCTGPRQPTIAVGSTAEQSDSAARPPYGRVEIPQGELANGLRSLFAQMSHAYGPIDPEPVIRDYVALIEDALEQRGYCQIKKLSINGLTVDLDIYFLVDESPARLNIDAFVEGSLKPTFRSVNRYWVADR